MHGGRNDKNEHDEFLFFPEVRAISRSVTSAATMNIVRLFLHVPTRKKSVGLHEMFVVVAIVAASVTLRLVAHTASDAIFVRIRVIGAAAVFLSAVAFELADENPFLLSHRHRVHQLLTLSAVAFRLFGSVVPKVAVVRAFELAQFYFFSFGEQLTLLIAFVACRILGRVKPAAAAACAVSAPKLSLLLSVSNRHAFYLLSYIAASFL